MTITLTEAESNELWVESQAQSYSPEHEPFLEVYAAPNAIAHGTHQSIKLYPDVVLEMGQLIHPETLRLKLPEAVHPLQFCVLLSGQIVDSQGGKLSLDYTMISGSGMQASMTAQMIPNQLMIWLGVEMPPERLAMFFPNEQGNLPAELEFLVKGDNWQTLIYPKSNTAIRQVAREMINCPHQGVAKRMFLQVKLQELIRLQVMTVLQDRGVRSRPCHLKPQTIAQIHAAKELLLANLEQPPSSEELAQRVGISDRTLQRGFRKLFGITVFDYLTEQRMIQAEQWLREKRQTVAEVAAIVGYSNPSHFTTAFKRQFGITPRDCLAGKKSVLR